MENIEDELVQNITLPPLATEQEVAVFLRIKIKTLQSWRSSGLGPHFIKVGRHVRYKREDILSYIQENTADSTISFGRYGKKANKTNDKKESK